MVSDKHTTRVAPNISSAASLSTSTSTHRANASVIHKAAFAPSALQLSLFASVIQGLNGHQVRIHDTVSGQLQCQHDTHAASITSLDWGFYGDADHLLERKTSKKKKRRLEEANGIKPRSGDVVLALGTNRSEIHFLSPANAKVIASLKSGHKSGVKAFKFTNYGLEGTGWSLGADKKLVQWNLRDQTILR
jgi:U3 small nucleolar RNA-associated protein 5